MKMDLQILMLLALTLVAPIRSDHPKGLADDLIQRIIRKGPLPNEPIDMPKNPQQLQEQLQRGEWRKLGTEDRFTLTYENEENRPIRLVVTLGGKNYEAIGVRRGPIALVIGRPWHVFRATPLIGPDSRYDLYIHYPSLDGQLNVSDLPI